MQKDLQGNIGLHKCRVVASHRQIQFPSFIHLWFSQKKTLVAHTQMYYPGERQETSMIKNFFNKIVLAENWELN